MKTLDHLLHQAKQASQQIQALPASARNQILRDLRRLLLASASEILRANKRDLARIPASYPHTDRLRLTSERIASMADSIKVVESLPDPLGHLLEHKKLPSGIALERVTFPLGVIGVIYESRPNVTVEVFSLAIKSGNVVVLKGGHDALESNKVLVKLIHAVLKKYDLPTAAATFLESSERTIIDELLRADKYVDLIIPRGGNGLIQYVRQHALLPVIETGAGVCHMYVECSANLTWALRTVYNAKTRRVSVCNALDTLLVDRVIADKFLLQLGSKLAEAGVVLYVDKLSYNILSGTYPAKLLHHATASHYGKEFLSLAMSIKVVKDWHEAFAHIQKYSSKHSEGIVTGNKTLAKQFQKTIDAAAVYVNTSIGFTDGYEFGLGGEIGISTQKLHARGPMSIKELTTYKWLISGKGAIRPR